MDQNRAYWERRAELIEEAEHKLALKLSKDMADALNHAYAGIEKEIFALYGKYADEHGMSIADARKYLTDSERAEFRHDVNDYVEMASNNTDGRFSAELDALSTRARIDRLEALQTRSAMYIREAYADMEQSMKDKLADIIKDTSIRTAYEIQTANKEYEPFAIVDTKTLDKVLAKPWTADGKTFSDRLWKNQGVMITSVQREMTQGLISGVDPQRMAKNIDDEFGVGKSAAMRLALTEGAYFASDAARDTYEKYGITKFQVLVTLDDKTCDICAPEDDKIYDMDNFSPGDTAPPFHPNCRCTTIPYIENNVLAGDEKRAARNPDTGKTEIVDDMTYDEWYNNYIELPRLREYVKEYGIKGEVLLDIPDMDLSDYSFDEKHINAEREHNVTREESIHFVENAEIAIKRWNGRFINYYAKDGASYIDTINKNIRTAFRNDEFDEKIKGMLEVIENGKD